MAMEELIVVFFMANVIVFCFSPANGKSAVGDPGFRNDERWAESLRLRSRTKSGGAKIRLRKILFIYFSMCLLLKKIKND